VRRKKPAARTHAEGAGGARAPGAQADDGVRTRDPQLGKLMLYQLSYVRATPRLAGSLAGSYIRARAGRFLSAQGSLVLSLPNGETKLRCEPRSAAPWALALSIRRAPFT